MVGQQHPLVKPKLQFFPRDLREVNLHVLPFSGIEILGAAFNETAQHSLIAGIDFELPRAGGISGHLKRKRRSTAEFNHAAQDDAPDSIARPGSEHVTFEVCDAADATDAATGTPETSPFES